MRTPLAFLLALHSMNLASTTAASVITPKPASHDHLKTGQAIRPRTNWFYRRWAETRKGFSARGLQTLSIMTVPERRIRQRRDATGAPIQRPEWLGAA
jgi:hypothetical protein